MIKIQDCCDPVELLNLRGRKGLIVGMANARSLAWPAALHFRKAGAELAITYVDERARPHVEPLARELGAPIILPCDVLVPDALEVVFDAMARRWERLDFILHAVGSVRKDDLRGRLVDCSADGFGEAMLSSCHSLIRMARLAEPMMSAGGSLLTLSYFGAEKVVEHYNVMGPVKAALEASVRYLAHELGPSGVRVNAVSAGPVRTRAASGIRQFDELLESTARSSPLRRNVEADEIGRMALVLVSDYAAGTTGEILHVDAGFHVESAGFAPDRPTELASADP